MFAALFLPDQMLLIRILAAFLTALAVVLACGGRFIAFCTAVRDWASRSAKTARKATC